MKRRLLAILLACTMILGLAACGGGTAPKSSKAPETSKAADDKSGADKAGAETKSGAGQSGAENQPGADETKSGVADTAAESKNGEDGQKAGNAAKANGAGAAGTKSPQDFEKFKIGVCESQSNDAVVLRRNYYENYIAPKYNVEFVFSEQLTDAEAEMNFIENCVDLGCKAIIGYRSDDVNQMSKVCQEYGLVYTVNTTRTPKNEEAFKTSAEFFTGVWGTEPSIVAEQFKEWLKKVASKDGSEGFMVTSALAFKGNTMHAECTQGVLAALQDLYGLKYEDTIENIAATPVPLEVPNDKDIKIYIYPGTNSTTDGWVQGASTALQTGKYGVFLQAAPTFTYTGVVVDEVERGFDMDIKVATSASISETLVSAFNTDDKFGNASLDMATVQSISFISGMGFVQVYNALTGYEGLDRDSNKEAAVFNAPMWALETKDQVNTVAIWDNPDTKSWVFDENLINAALGIYHPELTYENLVDYYNSITYDYVKENMG